MPDRPVPRLRLKLLCLLVVGAVIALGGVSVEHHPGDPLPPDPPKVIAVCADHGGVKHAPGTTFRKFVRCNDGHIEHVYYPYEEPDAR